MKHEDAQPIAQDFLDRQGDATIAGDVDATLEWCDIPCTLESMEGRAVAKNETEMRAICLSFINGLKGNRFTHMVRKVQEAIFKDEDTIWATYETRYVQNGNFLPEEPYVGFVILKRKDDRWKISTMQFAVSSNSLANVTLRDWASGRQES